MAFDLREENLRHQAEWKGFAIFLAASTVAVVAVLGILALTLL